MKNLMKRVLLSSALAASTLLPTDAASKTTYYGSASFTTSVTDSLASNTASAGTGAFSYLKVTVYGYNSSTNSIVYAGTRDYSKLYVELSKSSCVGISYFSYAVGNATINGTYCSSGMVLNRY